jgi:transporter family protein
MNWLIIIVVAYFLNAVATTTDKFLLSKKINNPAVYAFFISGLSALAIVLAPFGFKFIYSPWQIGLDLLAGVAFSFAYLFMFKALAKNEASRITPFMGGWQPIFVLILAMVFLGEDLSLKGLIGFALIMIGTVVISRQKSGPKTKNGYLLALIATLLFAISYTMSKYIFVSQDFITGFVWSRIGTALGALLFLFSAVNRRDIKAQLKSKDKQSGGLFLFGQTCGALSLVMVNYAISIYSSVAIINALRGLEYVFLLIITTTLAFKFPNILKEKFTPQILIQKIIATALIIGGLIFLVK